MPGKAIEVFFQGLRGALGRACIVKKRRDSLVLMSTGSQEAFRREVKKSVVDFTW